MIIEEIRLLSFKGFRDFSVKFSQFTCLVGPNNGGKTSVLQAIQLVHDVFRLAFGNGERPSFGNVQWIANPEQSLRRLSFGDPDTVWLHKKTAEPCKIEVKLSTGVEIRLHIKGRNQYHLSLLLDGKPIDGPSLETQHRDVVNAVFAIRPVYVPPVGAVTPSENFLPQPNLAGLLSEGRGSACWRSQLYWLWNDGDRDAFDGIVRRIQEYLPDATILPPRLTHGNPPDVLIQFQEEGTTFDISTSGGGLRTLLNLAVVLQFSGSNCLLLDEPDAHLHGTLQKAVARMLLDFCQEEDIQVIVASHAPEMIAEVPVALQTWIDRKTTEAGTTNSLGTFLADLGALSKADAIRACGADKVLFLEGALDKRLLKHLFSLSGVRSPFDDPQVIVASLPSGKGDSVHLKMFHRLLFEAFHLDVKVACITDRDFELKEKDGADNDAQVLALGRKEVENFFLVPDVLLSAVNHAAEKRIAKTRQQVRRPVTEEIIGALESVVSQAAVKNAVRWQLVPQFRESLDRSQHPSSREAEADAWFETRWSDASWRIKNCPGKQVLAEFRRWCQGNFGLTLTNTELTRAIVTCPPDIAEIARKLSEHFYQ